MGQDAAFVYGGYTQAALDAQYDQSTLVPDLGPYFTRWQAESDAARAELASEGDVPYGPSEHERLDVFPGVGPGSPVLVFLHGGAWALTGKGLFGYLARTFVPAGACCVFPEFAPAPEVSLDEMVRQVRAALAWVAGHITRFGGDPTRIVLCGHSSGAHLAAMALARGDGAAPVEGIRGAVLVSGPYDLEPVRYSARNDYLNLDANAAHRNTPLHHLGPDTPPLFVAWADGDLPEFQRQGAAFAQGCRERELDVSEAVVEGRNHFDTTFDLADPQHRLGRTVLSQLGLT